MNRRISPSTIIASVALFFSLGGASLAASHYLITNVNQIKPSVRHQLRNERDARGPTGPQGSQGSRGPLGPQAVIQDTYTQGSLVNIPANTEGTATAACPSGSAPTGGGFQATGGTVIVSAPHPAVGIIAAYWLAQINNSTSSTVSASAWVACSS